MSLSRVRAVSSGKRPGRPTWPSTETWLPRICSSSTVTCGRWMKPPPSSALAMRRSASAAVSPPRRTAPISGIVTVPLSLMRDSSVRSGFWKTCTRTTSPAAIT